MKKKNNILFPKILTGITFIALLFLFTSNVSAKGIIIADEAKETDLFNKSEDSIILFANQLSGQYNKVILHLGRTYVFRNGNIFTSVKSKKNLVTFCNLLESKNVKVFLWMLDSYGGDRFQEVYKEHQSIISENVSVLDTLHISFSGVVIDMEWINRRNYHNNEKFVQLLGYLKNKIGDKNLYFFASLINDNKENMSRGYNMKNINEIARPIDMLYINDSGYNLSNDQLQPNLDDDRIVELKRFFKKKQWLVACSFVSGFVIIRNENQVTLDHKAIDMTNILPNLSLDKKQENTFYTIYNYTVKKRFVIKNSLDEFMTAKKNDVFCHIEVKPDIAEENDFIWEYFYLNQKNTNNENTGMRE